jgi:RNA polymerase sigma-70 factor (ECF subfamily)
MPGRALFPINPNARHKFSCREIDTIGGTPVPNDLANLLDAKLLARQYAASRAAQWGLSEARFREIVGMVVQKYAADRASAAELLDSLRVEELALARACAAGHEGAWTEFMTRYRVKLYDSARAITREDASARELADGIYAELYGLNESGGTRKSKLEHYSGRGSLEGWLRTVLAQEWVNRYRKQKRETSLEEQAEAGAQFAAAPPSNAIPDHAALVNATDATLSQLEDEDRFILASYHLDGRRLADIAKTLGVHESTISRRVDKIATQVRAGILKHLQRQGLSRRQAEEAMAADVRDVQVDVRSRLRAVQESEERAFFQGKESK